MSKQSQTIMVSEKQDQQHNDIESQTTQPQPPRSGFLLLWLTFVLACMAIIIISHWNDPNANIHGSKSTAQVQKLLHSSTYGILPPASAPTSSCDPLSLRREWRTLSTPEQSAYQAAIHCLMKTPSITDNGSHYTDFLSAYSHENWNVNKSIMLYLPWNRWYLHAFERSLRRECHYTGDMVYIDWTQDLEEVSSASVKEFMGTEQGPQRPITEAVGGNVKSSYLDSEHISRVLSASTYNSFVTSLQQNTAKLSPLDLSSAEVPQDPSFLHQMQMDRLWWMWQQRNPHVDLPVEISVSEISLDGLATPVRVAGIADAEAGGLCYRYI